VIADPNNKFLVVAYPYATYDNTDHLLKQNIIWLPRIDQLIELSCMQDADFFIECIKMEYLLEPDPSAEIKGLAAVMKCIYNKYWNGEDWIKQ